MRRNRHNAPRRSAVSGENVHVKTLVCGSVPRSHRDGGAFDRVLITALAVVFVRGGCRARNSAFVFVPPPGPCACIGHFYIRIDTHISTCAQAHVRTVGTARPRHPRHFPPLLCAAMHAVPLVPAAVPLAGARKNKKQRRKPEHRDEEKGRRLPPASEVLSPRAQRARLLPASDCPRGNRQSSWDADGLSPRTHPHPPPPVLPSMTWMYGLRRRARLTQRGGAVSRRSEKGR